MLSFWSNRHGTNQIASELSYKPVPSAFPRIAGIPQSGTFGSPNDSIASRPTYPRGSLDEVPGPSVCPA